MAVTEADVQIPIGQYTEPDPESEEPQRRIRIEKTFENGVIVRIEGARFTEETDKRFIVLVAVKELTE